MGLVSSLSTAMCPETVVDLWRDGFLVGVRPRVGVFWASCDVVS